MLSVGPKVDLEWSGDRFRGPQHFWDFQKRRKRSLWATKFIWSGLETVFGDLRAFSGFPEKAKTLSVGPKLIWSGLETVFGDLSIFGISRKGKNALCGLQS